MRKISVQVTVVLEKEIEVTEEEYSAVANGPQSVPERLLEVADAMLNETETAVNQLHRVDWCWTSYFGDDDEELAEIS